MNIADLTIQGVDLEMACANLVVIVDDIEKLKAKLSELIDDTDPELWVGSRFPELRVGKRYRGLISIKALIDDVGMAAFRACRSVNAALARQQASLPTPEDLA